MHLMVVALCKFMVLLLLINSGLSKPTRVISKRFTSHPNWKLLNVMDTCGGPAVLQKRIAGGKDALLGQYPWMAYLMSDQFLFQCGGSIINHRYILTAAHCGPGLVKVRLGEHESREGTSPADLCESPAQDYNIEETMCHYWTLKHIHDDICLIRVDRDIQFNHFVKPICLPFYTHLQDMQLEKEYMEVAGWGTVNSSMEVPPVLQTLEVPVMSLQECTSLYREIDPVHYEKYMVIVGTHVCAGREKNRSACHGDSGGPLMKRVVVGRDTRYFQFGVVSLADVRCGQGAGDWLPSVYTRVDSYLEWILDHIHE